jgi:excisionase family DNA binding protein
LKKGGSWKKCPVSRSEVVLHDSGSPFPFVFNNCISVKVAAYHSGYNVQYLRRLLRDGRLTGMKLGQTWLIDKGTFEVYLENANHTQD